MNDVLKTPFLGHLEELSSTYHTRLLELRETVAGWLAYIPATFPHYTQHGVQHGDEIVSQLSQLLFSPESGQPSVAFSAVELYALAAAAYLHDTGMVASEARKAEILASDDWKEWCESSPGVSERLARIDELRASPDLATPEVANFLADGQLRFLISDFVRRRHHVASAELVTAHQAELSRFGFDDPSLIETIAALCEGHGLDRQDLEDNTKFPQRRSIRNEVANVRFLGLLLRMGDLLDMSVDRACPLLQVAACPLPADSFAHWTQYQRIPHRLTAPDRIELRASCEKQEEHRYLADWCDWLVAEVRHAGAIMARAERHENWVAPVATDTGPGSTISIEPAPGATYIPSDWTMELDQDFVFERLIFDAYGEDIAFVRELIQNAADATRCRALADAHRLEVQSPTELPKDFRDEFPIAVGVRRELVHNELTQCEEERQVLYVDDRGTGMDSETMERFFLQVGRSYYSSKRFKERYAFSPSSRFGLGFLSVFAVSDRVVVETRHHESGDAALRVTLTGPRSYLLTETGERDGPGTRIEVHLREEIPDDAVEEAVRKWCRRLEFPLHLELDGRTEVIEAESVDDFLTEPIDVAGGEKVAVRAYPVERDGIEGDLFQVVRVLADGSESWSSQGDALRKYGLEHPGSEGLMVPEALVCVAGIMLADDFFLSQPGPVRVDFRMPVKDLSLSREPSGETVRQLAGGEPIRSRWVELLREHLASTPRVEDEDEEGGWRYKQALMWRFPFDEVWLAEPGTVPVERCGREELLSLEQIARVDVLATLIDPGELHLIADDRLDADPVWETEADGLGIETRQWLGNLCLDHLFGDRSVAEVRMTGSGHLQVLWVKGGDAQTVDDGRIHRVDIAPVESEKVIGMRLLRGEDSRLRCVLNSNHPFGQWVACVLRDGAVGGAAVPEIARRKLFQVLQSAIPFPSGQYTDELAAVVSAWGQIEGLPDDLYPPPDLEITQKSFELPL